MTTKAARSLTLVPHSLTLLKHSLEIRFFLRLPPRVGTIGAKLASPCNQEFGFYLTRKSPGILLGRGSFAGLVQIEIVSRE
jgi:hypothetical protein